MLARQKLGNPIFIGAVLMLVLNDWYLKQTLANSLTGKLSDVTGLFAFTFFFSAVFPRKVKLVHLFTTLLFLIWKSPLAQPLIDGLGTLGLPLSRTVDYTDYLALMILPVSYYAFKTPVKHALKPAWLSAISVFSLLAFAATSLPPGSYKKVDHINKTYPFNFSKRELVTRLNAMQLDYVHEINKNIKYQNGLNRGNTVKDSSFIDFDSRTSTFYYSGAFSNGKKDTIARLIDYERVKDTDTIPLKTSYANITISGNENNSEIKLISLVHYARRSDKGDHDEKALTLFEKYVVKKLKGRGK